MSNPVTRCMDWFFGRGAYAVTVPGMDGALRPNALLDEAPALVCDPAPDNIVSLGGSFFHSCGHDLRQWHPDAPAPATLHSFDRPIAAMAALSDGTLAIALADGTVLLRGPEGTRQLSAPQSNGLLCITALSETAPGVLALANGSARVHATDWAADLMQRNATGSVWLLDSAQDTVRPLAHGLAYAAGVLSDGRRLIVSEAWAHRLVAVPLSGGAPTALTAHLPGYPGRIVADPSGGAWLCVFAPRSQLIEFVLRERGYRERMMREVPRELWIAPALRSGESFLEPLQGGAVKQLGILKPWAPTRSYGLLVRLDDAFQPLFSLHSRADGRRHGVTSAALHADGRVCVTACGGDVILDCAPALTMEAEHAAAG